MSWRQPRDLFGPGTGDQLMMQEILDLLATDSSNNSPEHTISTSTSSSTDHSNRHGSVGTEFNRSFAYGSSINEPLNEEMNHIVNLSSADDVGSAEAWGYAIDKTSSENNDISIKDIPVAGQKAVQQRIDSTGGLAQQTQMQDSIYATTQQLYDEDSRVVSPAFEIDLPRVPMSLPIPVASPAPEVPSILNGSSVPSQQKKSPSISNVLPTGKRVHLLNSAEFNELRRKLRMQTASRRYRKRRKEQSRHQKMQLQELQAELARLHEYESQWNQYQQRSVESLQDELEMRKNEAASLTKTIKVAAKEELDWVELMSNHLRKKSKCTSN
ncbi:unnamed protein product [Peronospora farinosa]|uniref:BZIP domain-containing protein n=1 Tax=Peronospora farinosa TaxID=134698 RepID=A0AAV0TIR7_9STRA|nr:unnamed protein product [Peronospora farinosa]